jgi:methanogen extracellular protein (TIGR04279 family)
MKRELLFIVLLAMTAEVHGSPFLVSINATPDKVHLARPGDSATEGNWMTLTGGYPIGFPQMDYTYTGVKSSGNITLDFDNSSPFSVTCPFTSQDVYVGSSTVTLTFFGDSSSFANKAADVYTVRTTPTELRDAVDHLYDGDSTLFKSLLDSAVKKSTNQPINATGGLTLDIGPLAPGDYVVFLLLNTAGSPFGFSSNDLPVLGMVPLQVLEYGSAVAAPSSVTQGSNLDITAQIGGSPPGSYRYGVMLWKKSRGLDLLMEHDGTKAGLDLKANGQDLVEGFVFMGVGLNNVDKTVAQERLEGMVGQGNGAVGITDYVNDTTKTITLSTSGLETGEYLLYTALWQDVTSKIIAFNQTTVAIKAQPQEPQKEGGGSPPPPPGLLYKYLWVETVGGGTVLEFEVPRDWLERHDVDPETVNLYKYAQRWIRLEPTVVAEDDDYIHYSREILASGRLAITGVAGSGYTPLQPSALIAAAPPTTSPPSIAPRVVETISPPSITPRLVKTIPPEPMTPSKEPPTSRYLLFLLAMVVMAVAVATYYFRKKRKGTVPK